MNGKGDGSRRPEIKKPPKQHVELSGHVDIHHLGTSGDNAALLAILTRIETKLDALGSGGAGDAQQQIDKHAAKLGAANTALAADVAAGQPKE